MLKKAAGMLILDQQLFYLAPQVGVVAAHLAEEGLSLGWLERQGSLEQLFYELAKRLFKWPI